MRAVAALALLSALLSIAPTTANAQDALGTVSLTAGSFSDTTLFDLSTVPWRFRDGDDPVYADPDFDDSDWQLADTDCYPAAQCPEPWLGLGWFRLHVRVDSSLRNTSIAVNTYQLGASEIYLNGQLVDRHGSIGEAPNDDKYYATKGLISILHFDDQREYVVAVRYTNRSLSAVTLHELKDRPFVPTGFALVAGSRSVVTRDYTFRKSAIYWNAAVTGFLLAIGLLNLVLYAFHRSELAHLLYGATIAAMVPAMVADHTISYRFLTATGSLDLGLLDRFGDIGVLAFLPLVVATLYATFFPDALRRRWRVGLLLLGIAGIANLLVDNVALRAIYVFGGFGEALRLSVLAVYKREEGAGILGVALIITIAATALLLSSGPQASRVTVATSPLWFGSNGLALGVFYLAIPTGMTMLLSRRYATRSRRLALELKRVEELSEKTLQQERERQALVEQQKHVLEIEVADRTAELRRSLEELEATQAQLVQQEKLASLGQLTAGIAHEIKNPVNFINNFAELNSELAAEIVAEFAAHPDLRVADVADVLNDLRQNAELITEHGKRADSIVRSMMQHASGGSSLRESTDVNTMVNEHVDLAYYGKRAQAPEFSVEVVRQLDDAVGAIDMMPVEIGRVLVNLLNNAFDAVRETAESEIGDPGYKPEVRVETEARDGAVEIRVTDNGSGIPADIRDKIFEPFFTTKPTGTGTGLGLSLSYDIVVQGHGGSLRHETPEGGGTTFVISLPQ